MLEKVQLTADRLDEVESPDKSDSEQETILNQHPDLLLSNSSNRSNSNNNNNDQSNALQNSQTSPPLNSSISTSNSNSNLYSPKFKRPSSLKHEVSYSQDTILNDSSNKQKKKSSGKHTQISTESFTQPEEKHNPTDRPVPKSALKLSDNFETVDDHIGDYNDEQDEIQNTNTNTNSSLNDDFERDQDDLQFDEGDDSNIETQGPLIGRRGGRARKGSLLFSPNTNNENNEYHKPTAMQSSSPPRSSSAFRTPGSQKSAKSVSRSVSFATSDEPSSDDDHWKNDDDRGYSRTPIEFYPLSSSNPASEDEDEETIEPTASDRNPLEFTAFSQNNSTNDLLGPGNNNSALSNPNAPIVSNQSQPQQAQAIHSPPHSAYLNSPPLAVPHVARQLSSNKQLTNVNTNLNANTTNIKKASFRQTEPMESENNNNEEELGRSYSTCMLF